MLKLLPALLACMMLGAVQPACADDSEPWFTPERIAKVKADAEAGDDVAQNLLGAMYSVRQNYVEARRWYEKAAAQGNALAQFSLGSVYAQGRGVRQDWAEARRWYEKAAAQGYAEAQFNLGWMYDEGKGVRQDYAEARRWYEKAAAQGQVDAQFNLGAKYLLGIGARQDARTAKEWFGKACDKGLQKGCDEYRKLNEAGF